jgi:hypothetical protein
MLLRMASFTSITPSFMRLKSYREQLRRADSVWERGR